MPRIPSLSFREVERLLLEHGFMLDHVKGSHYVYYHKAKALRVTVPRHTKDLPRGTLLSILKQAHIDYDSEAG